MSVETELNSIMNSVFSNTLVPGLTLADDISVLPGGARTYTPGVGMGAAPAALGTKGMARSMTFADAAELASPVRSNPPAEKTSGADVVILVQPTAALTDLTLKDKIVAGGKTYDIVNFLPKKAGATVLYFKCQCRGI